MFENLFYRYLDKHGMTVKSVAEDLGVSESDVNSIANGREIITTELAQSFAISSGVPYCLWIDKTRECALNGHERARKFMRWGWPKKRLSLVVSEMETSKKKWLEEEDG